MQRQIQKPAREINNETMKAVFGTERECHWFKEAKRQLEGKPLEMCMSCNGYDFQCDYYLRSDQIPR